MTIDHDCTKDVVDLNEWLKSTQELIDTILKQIDDEDARRSGLAAKIANIIAPVCRNAIKAVRHHGANNIPYESLDEQVATLSIMIGSFEISKALIGMSARGLRELGIVHPELIIDGDDRFERGGAQ